MEFNDVSMYFARGASKSQREKKQDRAYETRLWMRNTIKHTQYVGWAWSVGSVRFGLFGDGVG